MPAFRPEASSNLELYNHATGTAGPLPVHADVSVVYGRESIHLVDAAAEAAAISDALAVSGFVGKDSGRRRTPEADYVINGVVARGAISRERTYAGYKARDGLGGAIELLDLLEIALRRAGIASPDAVVAVIHGPSARRLGDIFAYQSERRAVDLGELTIYPTRFPFDPDPENVTHGLEIATETVLLDMLSRGPLPALRRPEGLTQDMLDYATTAAAYYRQRCREQGIRNPSTADNTDPSQPVLKSMLLFTPEGKSVPMQIGINTLRLAQAACRRLLAQGFKPHTIGTEPEHEVSLDVMSTFQPEVAKVASIYDYLVEPARALPENIDVAVVYGRKSRHLGHAVIQAARRSRHLLVTGETGKDSGDNPRFGIPESDYLLSVASFGGASLAHAMVDPYHPKNGIDNAHNTMRLVRENLGLTAVGTMVGVMHATQARRLGLTLAAEAERVGVRVDELSLYASPYPFDPSNRFDQREAAFEIVRMAQLADEGVIARPAGLDDHLPYATDLLAYHEAAFAAENPPILNSSTADDAMRYVHPDDLAAMYAAARQ